MKKIFLFVITMIATTSFAQNSINIKEDFSSNKLKWDEFFEKEVSGYFENGFYVLKCKEV